MATIQAITKAKATGLILKNLLGVEPQYDYQDEYVRLFYSGQGLNQVHEKINNIAVKSKTPGDVRVDFVPMVAPVAIKKIIPYALGTLLVGYIIGKAT